MEEQQNQPPRRQISTEQFASDKISIGWPWHLLVFSIFLFVLSVFVYFGLAFGYQAFLDERMSEIDGEFDNLSRAVTLEEQERFITFYSRVSNLGTIFERHILPSLIFDILERNTITSGLYFTDAVFDLNTRVLELKGIAIDFDSVARQMAVLDRLPEIQRSILSNIRLVAGETTFDIELTLNREFIRMAGPTAIAPPPDFGGDEPYMVGMTTLDCLALEDPEESAFCQQDLVDIFSANLGQCRVSVGTTVIGWEVILQTYRKYEIKGIENNNCIVEFEMKSFDPALEGELEDILNKKMTCSYGPRERNLESVANMESCSGPLYDSLIDFAEQLDHLD